MLNATFSVIFKHSAQVSKVIHSSFPKFDTCLFLFFLTDDEFLPKWNAHTIQLSSAGLLTNDFVTSEIDDHAHRMLKHLITKHLQV